MIIILLILFSLKGRFKVLFQPDNQRHFEALFFI